MIPSDEHIVYGPVGQCIYCRSVFRGKELSREHIIPEGLGGRRILPKASCRKCATITSKFERLCLQEMLNGPRRMLRISGKKRKHKRTRPVYVGYYEDNQLVGREINPESHPGLFGLPVFSNPGILFGRPSGQPFLITGVKPVLFASDYELRSELLGSPSLLTIVPFYEFCQLLAKIAHAHAVAEFGLDKFDSFVTNMILGIDKNFADYVGSLGDIENRKINSLHTVATGYDRKPIIYVNINLFAPMNSHFYQVAVGQLNKNVQFFSTFVDPKKYD